GGRMTSLRGEDARFKVPVKAFAGVLRKLGKLGKVVTQSIRMEDITEAYQDTALRARLLQTMIAKLEALLAQAKTAGEKIALLKEISALNERLAIIQESKAALKHRAQYSDIALSVQTSPENVATVTLPQLSLFRWLAQTSPDGLPYHSQQAKFE